MTITIRAAGVQTLVQDTGRFGYLESGVGISGAFDRHSLALANRLVGNAETSAGLEALAGGLTLTTDSAVVVAVTGARGSVRVNQRVVSRNVPLVLVAGDELSIDPPTGGLRSYVAFAGGLDVAPVLGSRSRDELAGLGPAPLTAGAILPLGVPSREVPSIDIPVDRALLTTLRVIPGPHAVFFDVDALATLTSNAYDVSAQSNRIGVRFTGPRIVRALEMELPSAPMVRGALQVPPDGAPVMLGPDHPVTGGYPVVAVVVQSSVDDAAQLTPGQRIHFSLA